MIAGMKDNESTEEGKIFQYMRVHWPSMVREEWQVGDDEYPRILERVLADFTEGATLGRRMFRIAGQSGSGKTSQLLPGVEEWFDVREASPVLVAARRFVKYHPYEKEILEEYGRENIRKMTDEFSTILLFLTIKALIAKGYDIILDVTFLDVAVEEILMRMLVSGEYEVQTTMVAVSRDISDKHIKKRSGRVVAKKTADEFWRATGEAMQFYAEKFPENRIILWNAWDVSPVYDGEFKGCLDIWRKYIEIVTFPENGVDEEKLREGKVRYFRGE